MSESIFLMFSFSFSRFSSSILTIDSGVPVSSLRRVRSKYRLENMRSTSLFIESGEQYMPQYLSPSSELGKKITNGLLLYSLSFS